MNNFEKIKSYNIDELTKFLSDKINNACSFCIYDNHIINGVECSTDVCEQGIKMWLTDEVPNELKIKKNKIIVLLGASSVGKDTLAKALSLDLNIPIATSYTTRPQRSNEAHGIDYYFITEEEMERKFENNEVMEYTTYDIPSENRKYTYASTIEELTKEDIVLAILNPYGLYQLQNSPLKDNLVTILLECNDKERLMRALTRDENVNVDEVVDRYKRDKLDFDINKPKTDYVIRTDDDFFLVYQELKRIIKKIIEE